MSFYAASGGTVPGTEAPIFRHVPDTHGKLDHLPPEWERTDSLAALPDFAPSGNFTTALSWRQHATDSGSSTNTWRMSAFCSNKSCGNALRREWKFSSYLMPMVLQLSLGQQLEYARIADELNATGFETEPFGQRTIAVKAAPAGLPAAEFEKVIFEILETAEREYAGRKHWMRFGATFARPSPAAPRSRSTCIWNHQKSNGC